MRYLFSLTILLFGLSACVAIKPTPLVVETKMLADSFKTGNPSPEQIEILVRELPVGFFYYSSGQKKKLFAVPDYPSAGDANQVLMAIATEERAPFRGARKAEAIEAFQAQAAAVGANALYLPTEDSRLAFAIYVSPTSAQVDPPAAEVLAAEGQELEGYAPVGEAFEVALNEAKFEVTTQRGECMAFAFALNEGAVLNNDALHGFFFELTSQDALLGNRSLSPPKQEIENPDGLPISAPLNGAYVGLRGHASTAGCAMGDAGASLMLWTKGKSPNIGEGTLLVQRYGKTISEEELQAKKEKMDAGFARAEAEMQAQREQDERDRAAKEAADAAAKAAAKEAKASQSKAATTGGSSYYSMTLKSECDHTVSVFIGDTIHSNGTTTSISSNSVNSYSGTAPESYWVLDSSGDPVGSYTASPGKQNVVLLESCTGIVPK